ncbi:MAG: hypothetical protein ACTSUK_05570, partial [Promethearchaeota archaeon]
KVSIYLNCFDHCKNNLKNTPICLYSATWAELKVSSKMIKTIDLLVAGIRSKNHSIRFHLMFIIPYLSSTLVFVH